MSCVNFMSCTNANVSFKHEIDISIFEKCHHNISFGKIGIRKQGKFWKYQKKQYPVLIGIKHLKIFQVTILNYMKSL